MYDLAENYRLPILARGGEDSFLRSHFSPEKERRARDDINDDEMLEMQSLLLSHPRKKAKLFQTNELARKVRLSTNHKHHCVEYENSKKDDKRLHCALCGRKIYTRCTICKVYLCNVRRNDNPACCEIFHDESTDLMAFQREDAKPSAKRVST